MGGGRDGVDPFCGMEAFAAIPGVAPVLLIRSSTSALSYDAFRVLMKKTSGYLVGQLSCHLKHTATFLRVGRDNDIDSRIADIRVAVAYTWCDSLQHGEMFERRDSYALDEPEQSFSVSVESSLVENDEALGSLTSVLRLETIHHERRHLHWRDQVRQLGDDLPNTRSNCL